jgi:hypothetical protein
MTTATASATTRSLSAIAHEIRKDWTKPYFGAVPYIEAMQTLNKITDNYYYDSAHTIVLYFLANSQTWKGDTARRIKIELKKMAGI